MKAGLQCHCVLLFDPYSSWCPNSDNIVFSISFECVPFLFLPSVIDSRRAKKKTSNKQQKPTQVAPTTKQN